MHFKGIFLGSRAFFFTIFEYRKFTIKSVDYILYLKYALVTSVEDEIVPLTKVYWPINDDYLRPKM